MKKMKTIESFLISSIQKFICSLIKKINKFISSFTFIVTISHSPANTGLINNKDKKKLGNNTIYNNLIISYICIKYFFN